MRDLKYCIQREDDKYYRLTQTGTIQWVAALANATKFDLRREAMETARINSDAGGTVVPITKGQPRRPHQGQRTKSGRRKAFDVNDQRVVVQETAAGAYRVRHQASGFTRPVRGVETPKAAVRRFLSDALRAGVIDQETAQTPESAFVPVAGGGRNQ